MTNRAARVLTGFEPIYADSEPLQTKMKSLAVSPVTLYR
jgi:hypothetical protein